MSQSNTALEALNEHWAVVAIGVDELERSDIALQKRLARRAAGKQIDFFLAENVKDELFLRRVALAFELAAIEGLDELGRPNGENRKLRNQAVTASFRVFDIHSLLSVPEEAHDRLFFVLKLSAIAYCGNRWSDLLQWYREQGDGTLKAHSAAATEWDQRLLYRLFDCWGRLFCKQSRDDLHRIGEIVAGLRNDQRVHEAHCLQNRSGAINRAFALRLAALYNWANATETLAAYMLQGEPGDPFGMLDKHFEAGTKAAAASQDAHLEVTLRWLHATARIMVTNSQWWAMRAVNWHT